MSEGNSENKRPTSYDRPPSKAVFIDRDGTLIEEVNFLSRVEDLRYFADTAGALDRLKQAGFLIVVVTNQSGIGRGLFTENEMHAIHDRMRADLPGRFDAIFFCPHLPDAGCRCRKPNPGMIEAARAEFSIDLEKSWMIGDKALDVEFGAAAGLKTALVLTGYGRRERERLTSEPDVVGENLLEIVKIITAA
ncbi:MAG: HAD family hydrolase [Acidobacteria bacterium]|nr:HAD family hydrolase [Acidobacteriota bacterium]